MEHFSTYSQWYKTFLQKIKISHLAETAEIPNV